MTTFNLDNELRDTPWHNLSIEETFRRIGSHSEGLAEHEAAERLEKFGRNEITIHKPTPAWRLFLKQFANFFVLALLFAAALAFAVSFLPGESHRQLTALFILSIVFLTVILSFYEESHAQKELEALEKLLVFKVTVLREAAPRQVEAAMIVPGDVLVLSHGQRVPADARVIQAHSLRADESALTGESTGVDKDTAPVAAGVPLAERTGMVFASTYITQGNGLAVAVRTGMSSEVGQIAASLEQIAERPTPFQVEVQKMARQMTLIVGSLTALVAAILIFGLHEPLVDVALNSLSLAVATIPESLPIVLTFALALGAHRMARRQAVVRRLSVVESLGSVDTICSDKTGTLTQNQMTVECLYVDGETLTVGTEGMTESNGIRELLRSGCLCNETVIEDGSTRKVIGDPLEVALVNVAYNLGMDVEKERQEYKKVNENPFSSETKMMTTVHLWEGQYIAYTKGAVGAILARCAFVRENGQVISLDDQQRFVIQQAAAQLEKEAMYVLAFARKGNLPGSALDAADLDMEFLGLEAMMDPPRPEAAAAIARAKEAGIRVVMITGDNILTAGAIAKRLGIGVNCVETKELEQLTVEELGERLKAVDVVARATPQAKQRVLKALQDAGHFVAMTGDGVNDATALKQSDVGVAMGLRGTDIAKESAAMVLLDDHFATIVAAVEEGRRIFDNIRKFTNYLLSTSLGEVIVVLVLSIYGYFPLSAKMLLWINVVTDLVPASALAADPAVPHVMRRRPRRHNEPILNKAIYATIAGSILRTLVAYGLIFWVGLQWGGILYARTMLFTSIVLHAFTRVVVVRQMDNLSLWSNKALLWSYLAAVGLQLLALYTPLRDVFGILALDWHAWGVMVPVVVLSSLAGIYMTRWILKLLPLWEE